MQRGSARCAGSLLQSRALSHASSTPDRVIEAVRGADADERLTAGGGAGTGEGIERRDGKLRLRDGQPPLSA